MHWSLWYTLAVTLLVLTACGPAADGVSSAAPSAAASGGTIVTMTVSGGLAGRTETVTIDHGGAVAVLDGNGATTATGTATSAQIDALEDVLASDEWAQVEARYGRQVPDGFAYTLDAGGKRIEFFDGGELPPILQEALSQIVQIRQAVR